MFSDPLMTSAWASRACVSRPRMMRVCARPCMMRVHDARVRLIVAQDAIGGKMLTRRPWSARVSLVSDTLTLAHLPGAME